MMALVTQSLKVKMGQLSSYMSNNLQVSEEFLEEEELQLGQTRPKPKKKKNGGPYPAQTKKKRRDEVFKLHFDYGYSARKLQTCSKLTETQ